VTINDQQGRIFWKLIFIYHFEEIDCEFKNRSKENNYPAAASDKLKNKQNHPQKLFQLLIFHRKLAKVDTLALSGLSHVRMALAR
jgi:hypothetical protein